MPVPSSGSFRPANKVHKPHVELNFGESSRARAIFMRYEHECISSMYVLRTVLSEMGLYPPDAELQEVLRIYSNKVTFNAFCKYLAFLKVRYMRPEPRDSDTLRAFVALGGRTDRQGDINVDNLRDACRRFQLTIDIDRMISEVDTDASGAVDYPEFRDMWEAEEEQHAAQAHNGPGDEDAEDADLDALLVSGAPAPRQPKGLQRRTSSLANVDNVSMDEVDPLALLRFFLVPEKDKPKDGGDMRRKMSSIRAPRKSRLPSLRNGALNAALDVEGAQAASSEDEGGPQPTSGKDTTRGDKGGYRAPSPMILSQYTAKRAKPGSKLSPATTPRPPPSHSRSTRGGRLTYH